MLNSDNIKHVLSNTLEPVSIDSISFNSSVLQSSVLLSSSNGAVLSYVTSNKMNSGINSYSHTINNLKMMSLLIKDKWSDDEANTEEQTTSSCYNYIIPSENDNSGTEDRLNTRIYTYEIEDLHACVAQLPKSDILLLFIAEKQFPYGLLVMKMKNALLSFSSLYGYKLE